MKMGRGRKALLWFVVVTFAGVFVNATDDAESVGELLVCDEGDTRCDDNSRCYNPSMKCDGFSDCGDGSDEVYCGPTTCQSNQFRCVQDGQCIPLIYHCDGTSDCVDDSDEDKCREEAVQCDSESDFVCVSDRQCINSILKCDGELHCSDGSDEVDCTNTKRDEPIVTAGGQSSCTDDEFSCTGDGYHCISNELLCNGENDCDNGADEDDQTCDKQSEVATCEQNGKLCAQLCNNDAEDGGYKCACHEGYQLTDDKHDCLPVSGDEWVWITDGSMLIKSEIGTNRMVSLDVGRHIDALDYDFVENKTYWACSHNHTINRMDGDGSNSEILASDPLSRPTTLSFDWIHGNLYWSDLHTIEVVAVSRKQRHVLFNELAVHHVTTMAVDPRSLHRYLYWGQSGETPGIHRAGLDGSGRRRIVQSEIEHPAAMTMDFTSGHGKLIWLDSGLHSIMSLDVSTLESQLMFRITGSDLHLTGLAVSTGLLYWAERNGGRVYSVQKAGIRYGVPEEPVAELEHLNVPKNIVVYFHLKQPAGHNVCGPNNGGCSHICLPSPTGSAATHRCVCPNIGSSTVYTLNADNRTCTGRAESVHSDDDSHALIGSTVVHRTSTSPVGSHVAGADGGERHRPSKPGGPSPAAASGTVDGGATRSTVGSNVNVGKKNNDMGVAGSSTAAGQGRHIATVWTVIVAVGGLILSLSGYDANRI